MNISINKLLFILSIIISIILLLKNKDVSRIKLFFFNYIILSAILLVWLINKPIFINQVNENTKPIPYNVIKSYNILDNDKNFDEVVSIMQNNIKNLSIDVEQYNKLTDTDLTKYHLFRGLEMEENSNYKLRDIRKENLEHGVSKDDKRNVVLKVFGISHKISDLQKDSYIYTSINNEIAQNNSIIKSVEKEQLDFYDKISNAKTQKEKDKYVSVIVELSSYKKLIKSLIDRDEQYEQKNLSAFKTELANKQAFEDFEQKNLQTGFAKVSYALLHNTLEAPQNILKSFQRLVALSSRTSKEKLEILSSINQKKLGVINKHANPKTTDHEGNIVLLKDADSFHIPKDILSFNDWSFNGESLSYQLLIWFRNCLFAFIIVGLFIKNKKLS
jgi:hypothetical protein